MKDNSLSHICSELFVIERELWAACVCVYSTIGSGTCNIIDQSLHGIMQTDKTGEKYEG